MKNNKTVLLFLTKFFGVYLILFLLYSFYLKLNNPNDSFSALKCDAITQNVANKTLWVLKTAGFDAEIEPHKTENSIKLILNKTYVARVVEGCNSVSVIILFISFIIAFSGTFKNTILFIFFGGILIYAANIVRIAFIAVALYKFPEYEKILHDVVFPLIIYGLTFLLWILWVRKFSKNWL